MQVSTIILMTSQGLDLDVDCRPGICWYKVEMVEGFKGEATWLGEIFKQEFQEIIYFFLIN